MAEYTVSEIKEVEKLIARTNEILYQRSHRKVKDRYTSSAFFNNNFNKNRNSKRRRK